MMKTCLFAAVTALASFALAAPGSEHYARHEKRDESAHWIKRERVASDLLLPMRIGLTQSNLDRGYDLLMEVSDPDSLKYGQHYTVEEVHDIFAPSEESVEAVLTWLAEAGIDYASRSFNKQWLQFDAETGAAEKLLRTKFYVYKHTVTGKTLIGCDEYFVKKDVQKHIDYITPGVQMLELHLKSKKKHLRRTVTAEVDPARTDLVDRADATKYPDCSTFITPACIAEVYNIPVGTTKQAGNQLGIFAETPYSLDQNDLNLFFTNLATRIPNNTFPTVDEIDGAKNDPTTAPANPESILDTEISYPIIYPQNSIFYYTDSAYEVSLNKHGLFNTFLDAIDGSYCTYSAYGETGNNDTVDPVYPSQGYQHPLQCGAFSPTNVISLSYGLEEFKSGVTPNYQKRQCNEYMKLGLQGVSVVFASGDSGVGGPVGCYSKNSHTVFNPVFPAACPYVTAVGATYFDQKQNEIATTFMNGGSSGGGFSNYFARPSYQDSAVTTYFQSPQAPTYPYYTGPTIGSGYYNRSGRGFPDVAALGNYIAIYYEGSFQFTYGTSASAPLFAAILTRINEKRLIAKKSTVGFVNPVLYKNPTAFTDITAGSNPGCGTQGFSTATGWDPASGLGTPKYPALLNVFMSLS